MTDRRYLVRWQIDKNAVLKIENGGAYSVYQIENINFKGLKIVLKQKLPADPFLQLQLVLSDDFVINAQACIVWSRFINGFYVYGVSFLKISDVDKEKIYQFIRRDFSREINKSWWKDFSKDNPFSLAKGGDMRDRRIFARFRVELPVRFSGANDIKGGTAKLKDVSAKGIGLTFSDFLERNTPLEIWLDIPDHQEPLYMKGKVIWIRKAEPGNENNKEYRIGVNLDKTDLMGLSRIIRAMDLKK